MDFLWNATSDAPFSNFNSSDNLSDKEKDFNIDNFVEEKICSFVDATSSKKSTI